MSPGYLPLLEFLGSFPKQNPNTQILVSGSASRETQTKTTPSGVWEHVEKLEFLSVLDFLKYKLAMRLEYMNQSFMMVLAMKDKSFLIAKICPSGSTTDSGPFHCLRI